MIIELIIKAIFTLIYFLINLLPTLTIPFQNLYETFDTFFTFISNASYFVPIGTFATIMLGWIGFKLFMFSFNIVNYVISKIPFFN